MNTDIINHFIICVHLIFRGDLALDFSSRVEKYIDSSHSSLSIKNIGNGKERESNEENMFSIGRCLLKVTNNIDSTFGGMILNTYINCLLIGTTTLYACSSVFFNRSTGIAIYIISGICFLMTLLSLLRLMYHTNAGQSLASAMEESLDALTDIQMIVLEDKMYLHVKLLKEGIKNKCSSPINPFSAFSLSNSTLIGTFATILTYLIVLVQFKAAEDEEKTKLLTDMRNMLEHIMRNITTKMPD